VGSHSAEKPLKASNRGKEADDRLLIDAARKDPGRFVELYEDNFNRVYAYVARRVGSRQEAEDLTSEVFHRALEHLGQFEWRGVPFAAWLFGIARNAIRDRAERARTERANPGRAEPAGAEGQIDLEEIERRALLFRSVNALPDDQRRVIRMRFAEEKTIREIAQELRRSDGAVKQLQFRALKNLRARMKGRNG
jgi:RNA polymerase sigma-70 factor, ECF subfamily